ncbi:TRAP-type mannitol/chloroaromatic compound transport system, periplasmic component [Salmonella enterica]|uniref:TRAP-type mannitol/chloroaromatic compound transport system, periplasmic component n=1 Tax=Salmonella enterica TaxID=28901 RepID=A0A379Q7H0_SALER|nr:ABC transporter substrate-binding protein [Salmonella enterica subsp. salamae serovar Springs]SUF37501.1 TRAP-type mannitol/chloroaromatic compound transport system, periplasmic component [Salmonella enterica]HCM1984341.1 TRAP transporter substrate-binding protein DctP [Salmonella enterica subsp. salamae serovar 40:a:z39]
MKKLHLIKPAIAFLFISLFLPVVSPAAQTLTYRDHEPLGDMRTRFINDVLFPAIEKESQGRLKIVAHWGGEISNGYEALRKTGKEGAVDMAIVVPEYAADALPLHQVFKSFPVGPSGEQQIAFFRRAYADIPAFSSELQKANVVAIFLATGYPMSFFSAKPLPTVNDVKGGTWRSASFWQRGFLKNLGAKPVTMPWGEETRKALQAGTIDGMILNVDSGYSLKAQQFAPNVLISKNLWLGHLYLLVMNKKTWDNLSHDDQAAIQRAADTAYRALGPVMDSSFDAQIADLRNDGATVRLLTPEEVIQWATETHYQQAQSDWVTTQEAKGIKDAGTVMNQVNVLMDETMKQKTR